MEPSNTTEASVGYLVYEGARAFRRRFEDEARRHDLTLPQWRALAELARFEALGIVMVEGSRITIKPEWRSAARLVASCFDQYLGGRTARHSAAV